VLWRSVGGQNMNVESNSSTARWGGRPMRYCARRLFIDRSIEKIEWWFAVADGHMNESKHNNGVRRLHFATTRRAGVGRRTNERRHAVCESYLPLSAGSPDIFRPRQTVLGLASRRSGRPRMYQGLRGGSDPIRPHPFLDELVDVGVDLPLTDLKKDGKGNDRPSSGVSSGRRTKRSF
jgi:hypothetical protein